MASTDSAPFSSLSPRRKSRRSPSQNPSSSSENAETRLRQCRRHDLSVEVCKEFIRRACRRAEIVCKFAHPPSNVTIERDKVTACADSLHNRCFRGRTCRYFHPPPHIQESLLKSIRMDDANDPVPSPYRKRQRSSSSSPSDGGEDAKASRRQRPRHDLSVEVCQDFIRSGCRRAEIDCKFAHPPSGVSTERGKVIACIDSLRGKCFRGRTCHYFHPPPQIQESLLKVIGMEGIKDQMALQYLGSAVNLPSYPQPRNDHDVVPVCKDFLKNSCKRDYCKYFHLIPQSEVYLQQNETFVKLHSPPPHETEQRRVSVCRDFLKNACQRDSCKYAHPNSRTKVVDNQVEICQDFYRGLCHRANCHFYHPRTHSAKK